MSQAPQNPDMNGASRSSSELCFARAWHAALSMSAAAAIAFDRAIDTAAFRAFRAVEIAPAACYTGRDGCVPIRDRGGLEKRQ